MGDEPTPTATTGATPATGATPVGAAAAGQTTPAASATPAASTTQQPASATDDSALGESGKAILREARAAAKAADDRARAAEAERDALKTATLSDTEKALADARKDAEKTTSEKFTGLIRRSEVRRALTAAGIAESELELASMAPEFGRLKVGDDGNVEHITETVATFKTAHPGLFARAGGAGPDYGGGVRNGTASTLTRADIDRMTPDELIRRMPEIDAFMQTTGRTPR